MKKLYFYLVTVICISILSGCKEPALNGTEAGNETTEVLETFSTPEGQNALMNEESASISNVKGTDSTSGRVFMDSVASTIAKGNIFPEVRYTELAFNNPFQVAFREALMGYIDGTMEMEEAMTHCDEAMQALKNAVEPKEEVYGTATVKFTVLETAEFVADISVRKQRQT